ncbi:acetylcholine receptor subunit alpha-type acr-16-like isoform X1 [Stegodyphus dumicola]|uniref:acetylcholine receptor subunit alpha-type acr-16-like isoform X1 n=1 Tax=Stegodyphus dumicola TaxID=202533 RepID=UPI0015AADC49|nr:acetylcholine receptor subunit alpha-type acr-16-like isoform X1 [Stegodyphus dumicola]
MHIGVPYLKKCLKFLIGGILIVILFFLFLQVQPSEGQQVLDATPASELRRLRSDLLKNYDKITLPVLNQSLPITVKLLFDIQYIVSLDEKYQILTVKGILMLKWIDEHLKWDSGSYSGISAVRFSPQEVWLPDIHSLYNVKSVDIFDKDHGAPVLVYSNGSVKWYPPAVFDVPCSTQFKHYPFDRHNCTIVFGSWSHLGDAIVLETIELPLAPSNEAQSSEWVLTNVTHENFIYTMQKEYYKYHVVNVHVYLQRTSRIYRYICVVPSLIALFSTLFGFWLLPHETSRYMIGCSNIIVMSLLLQHLAMTTPAGKDIPLIAQYSATCLCMSTLFVLITVVTNLLRDSSGAPPNGLVRLAHGTLDKYLCLFMFSYFTNEDKILAEVSSETRSVTSLEEVKKRNDWICVSLVIDRIAFFVFTFIYIILIIVLASV